MREALTRLVWSRTGSVVVVFTALAASLALSSSALWFIPIACLPLYFSFGVSRRARRLSELHLSTIEALALAIDAKDQTAHNHIRRVQIYAIGLARAVGMADTDIQGVKTAALL